MKKSFHVFFLFVLFAFFAVNAAWAYIVEGVPTHSLSGEVTADKATAEEGESVTLTITPASGYMLENLVVRRYRGGDDQQEVDVNTSGVNSLTGGTATFTMPAFSVSVIPTFAEVGHRVTITEVTGGTIETDKTTATEGTKVTLTIKPDVDNDYVLKSLEVKDAANNARYVGISGLNTLTVGTATFTMPASDVTVTPTWKQVEYEVTITNATGGSVTTDKATTTYGETVTLTIVPTSGYQFNSLEVKDAAENAVDVTFSSDKSEATFTMPKSNVTVKSFWNTELIEDGEGGYYVNMPVSGTNTLDLAEYIANGVTSFKVYDDGGKDGNFSSFVNGYLEMTAPAGYQFIIQGSMNTNCGDACVLGELNVFDGNASATRILQKWGNVSSINVHSSGNTMTLYFKYGSANYDYDTYSGLDFTVSVITQHSVNIADVSGGKISTNKETADEGTSVTLTATPDKGYILNSISVVGLDGKSVEVNNGTWRIGVNTITFSMPKEAVFVSPLFIPANEFSVPRDGRVEVVIPEGVESFKVYDDGGKDGNYSNSADGNLQLTAPENYVFQVSGSATTETAKDLLTIYDGAYGADKKLLDEQSGSIDLNGANVLTSSNNVITIGFQSSAFTNERGLDLKVTLVKPSYGAVTFAKADNGVFSATINGAYAGTDTLVIPEAISVDAVEYVRSLEAGVPATALLPVALPAGTTVNADFYTLEKVEQVDNGWHAVMRYIGDGKLPQPNTPYAFILNDGETALEFDLKGEKATVQTGEINKVCAFEDACTLDGEGQVENDWFFTGTYAYKVWDTDNGELGLAYAFAATDNPGGAAKGRFGKIASGAYANPLRAYLRKRDASVQLVAAARGLVAGNKSFATKNSLEYSPETIDVEFVKASIDGNEETTFVGRLNTRTGEFKMLRNYDLKGRMLNGKPKARGAYYGKRVINK